VRYRCNRFAQSPPCAAPLPQTACSAKGVPGASTGALPRGPLCGPWAVAKALAVEVRQRHGGGAMRDSHYGLSWWAGF
jgi:hypothetical protein